MDEQGFCFLTTCSEYRDVEQPGVLVSLGRRRSWVQIPPSRLVVRSNIVINSFLKKKPKTRCSITLPHNCLTWYVVYRYPRVWEVKSPLILPRNTHDVQQFYHVIGPEEVGASQTLSRFESGFDSRWSCFGIVA